MKLRRGPDGVAAGVGPCRWPPWSITAALATVVRVAVARTLVFGGYRRVQAARDVLAATVAVVIATRLAR